MNKSLTALMCLFVKAHHQKTNNIKIIADNVAKLLISDEECDTICKNIVKGIKFFAPSFKGTEQEIILYIVNTYLAPVVLARTAFVNDAIHTSLITGTKQYLIFASGYDTFAYNNKDLKVLEIDRSDVIDDKIRRLEKANISSNNVMFIRTDLKDSSWLNDLQNSLYSGKLKTICSLLGLSYYLTKKEFYDLLNTITSILKPGDSIIFDYPTKIDKKLAQLTKSANEEMKSCYSLKEMALILENSNFLIYEHLTAKDIDERYFYDYNTLNPNNKMIAPKNVNYCLAIKK